MICTSGGQKDNLNSVKSLLSLSALLILLLSAQIFGGVCELQCALGVHCSGSRSMTSAAMADMDHSYGHIASSGDMPSLQANCTDECPFQQIVATTQAQDSAAGQLMHSFGQTASVLPGVDAAAFPMRGIAARHRLRSGDFPISRPNSVLNIRV